MRNKKAVLKTDSHETILTPFSIRDHGNAISLLKNGKAPGLDNIHHEMIKCFGPTTRLWLLDMVNDSLKQQQIPNVWRKAKVVAMLKAGKYPESPKSYRPIALLCSLYNSVWARATKIGFSLPVSWQRLIVIFGKLIMSRIQNEVIAVWIV